MAFITPESLQNTIFKARGIDCTVEINESTEPMEVIIYYQGYCMCRIQYALIQTNDSILQHIPVALNIKNINLGVRMQILRLLPKHCTEIQQQIMAVEFDSGHEDSKPQIGLFRADHQ